MIINALMAISVLLSVIPPNMEPAYAMVEICDNAIDDDGDGQIDLNDPDCDCPEPEPISLIPNPSFEEKECCPNNRSQMSCASTWIQASSPTTDYIHTCGWMGWDDLPVPLPIPDGEGCVGFRNGRPGFTDTNYQPNWKEYTGACLDFPLKAGVSYKFRFYVGFTNAVNSPPTNIVFYGSSKCENLPFGPPNDSYGCPIGFQDWGELGRVAISGENTWKLYEINTTPFKDMAAMVIGPSCQDIDANSSIYYFFDNLVLAEESKFGFEINADPSSCSGSGNMSILARDSLAYQWYLNGTALLGETNNEIQGDLEEGFYKVRLTGPNSCAVTKAFNYKFDKTIYAHEIRICPGDVYEFNGTLLDEEGIYLDTLVTPLNCDSIVEIELNIDSEQADTVVAKIFKGEGYKVGNNEFTDPGTYDVGLISSIGCDSLVFLVLEEYNVFLPNIFSPNDDGQNDVFAIIGGEELLQISQIQIFDRWGGVVYDRSNSNLDGDQLFWDGNHQNKPVQTGVYLYIVRLIFDDGVERSINGTLTLIR
jgi:gliding motility-associated-like protein